MLILLTFNIIDKSLTNYCNRIKILSVKEDKLKLKFYYSYYDKKYSAVVIVNISRSALVREETKMKYGRAGQVLQKQLINVVMKDGMLTSRGYTDDYYYGLSANPYALTGTSDNAAFYWDNAGNMTFMKDRSTDTKLFFWTEDNRMQALITDHAAAFYRYDASGERELKLLATTRDVNVNGRNFKQPVYDYAVLYASGGLMTVDAAGYKKHYFMEGERILTSIGGGGNANIRPNEELRSVSGETIKDISEKYFDKYVSSYFPEHVNKGVGNPLEIPGDLDKVPDLYKRFDISVNQSISDIPYYYVPDYLGSGSVITNANANAVHMLAYIPFGEILLDLNNGFETPYKFAGYEHDQESGLSYASARYYAGMSRYPIFTTPDPMWYKYPHLTSYHYCSNNPITRIDPTGMGDYFADEIHLGYDGVNDGKVFKVEGSSKFSINDFKEGGKFYNNQIGFNELNGDGYSVNEVDMENSDLGLLSRIGYAEFRGSNSTEQQIGMDITLNRVENTKFPNTLKGVIEQPYQYSSLNKNDPNKKYFENPASTMTDKKGNTIESNRNAWVKSISNAISVLEGDKRGLSQGATLYYSPRSTIPKNSMPNWNFKILQEIKVEGVRESHLRFFKQK